MRQVLAGLRGPLLLTTAAALGWQLVVLLVPVVLGWVTTEAIERGRLAAVWWGAGLIVALAGAEALFDGGRHRLENAASARTGARLRRRVLRGVVTGGRRGLDTGDVVARGTDDVDVVAGLVDSLGYTIAYALSIPVAVGLLVTVDAGIAAGCVAVTVVGLAAVRLTARLYERRSAALQEASAAAMSEVQAVLGARTAARGLGIADALTARFVARSREIGRAARAVSNLEFLLGPVRAAATAAPVVVVLAWGGHRTIAGDLTLGGLVTAIGLALYLGGPVEAVIDQVVEFGVVRASVRRIATLSTVDAVAPAELTLGHDPVFWTGTVRDNLALGRRLGDDELGAAVSAVELDLGLDDELSDAGRKLSGGQRQRLAVARAVLHAQGRRIDPGAGLDGVGPAQRERLAARLRDRG